ncbi:MAG: glycoside hydrolase family 31 protein [Bacteroidales bacterium]|nr:glycoside hydrolase family 31 protein [Bacteroidales bacterium]
MKRFITTIAVTIMATALCFGQAQPKANSKAEVVSGKARFTVLTPRLIRMEWAADGRFEDRATLGIVNRNIGVPEFKTSKIAGVLTIKTSEMTLTYSGNANFGPHNLKVTFEMKGADGRTKKVTWHPGMDDSANLLGTTRTLDGCDGITTKEPYDKGVISRDGWAVIDESDRHILEPVKSDWKNWVAERTDVERSDLYFFGYGHDYMQAVSDFTKIAGKIPMPPKYAFGYWWCRYWQYSDFELEDLAQHFADFSIPMDVMIIDMDWHDTYGLSQKREKDASGERRGWTGYSWKKDLFPSPEHLLESLHRYGVKTSLNIHPASGMMPYEDQYNRFVADYLSRTSKYDGPKGYVDEAGNPVYVPFRIDQMEWADAYFNSVMHPLEKQGVDFWWLDWQQFKESKYIKGLSNTFWLNYTFFQDKVRQSAREGIYAERPMIYHRWGGVGSHRYQVGFSGDTRATWKVLAYLPYFTATASNLGYGYWGHDIGGHMQPKGVNYTDPELYTRWMQSGVFTPIYKTHSTKDSSMEKRFWVFPDHFDYMREAVRLRYNLSPYIYRAAREAYDTGISMCRPLYYYHPEEENAYTWKEEFYFGEDILATVVAEPCDSITGLAKREMWFPKGSDWYDVSTGTTYKGGTTQTLKYTIAENPYFVKAGAVIPMASPKIKSLQEASNELYLFVAPGKGNFTTKYYEDDGCTQAYSTQYATTEIFKTAKDGSLVVMVSPRKGSYKGMSDTRKVRVVVDGTYAPKSVKVNGVAVPYDRFASRRSGSGNSVWGYDGAELATTIYVEEVPADQQLLIECEFDRLAVTHPNLINGKKGLLKRMRAITPEYKLAFATNIDSMLQLPEQFTKYSQCASFITEDPDRTVGYLQSLDPAALEAEMRSFGKLPEDFIQRVMAQCK